MKKNLSILITGCGAPGTRGTIYALKNNPDNISIRFVGSDIKEDVVGRLWMEKFYVLPNPEQESYIDAILDVIRKENIDIVIPQTTREIQVLSHKKDCLSKETRIMVSSACAIQKANDKWQIIETFKQLQLPYPKHFMTRTENDFIQAVLDLGYPQVPVAVKPAVSNGMRGFRILKENAWDLERFLAEKPSGEEVSLNDLLSILKRGNSWPELLVTEYLPGPEYSVDAFIGVKNEIAIPRLRKSIRSGISFDNIVEFHEDIMKYTLIAGKHLGLQYAYGFQYKLDKNGIPKVLESNPRVQGTMVASLFCGINVIWLSVREIMDEPCMTIGAPTTHNISFKRFWGGIGITPDGIYEI